MTDPKRCYSKSRYLISLPAISLFLASCVADPSVERLSKDNQNNSKAPFEEVFDVIPFENRLRRKFDNVVVSDLDQDGRQDIIINEHGREMRIFWNDGNTFSQGPKIANGDVHGAAVADFDGSGKIDVIITQGGGDGANPRRPLWVEITKDRQIERGTPFDYFEPGRGRTAKFIPSPVDGDLNLIVTGFATPEQFETGANHYYDNVGQGEFKFSGHLPNAARLGFRTSVTDLNGDGIYDALFFGAGKVVVAQGQPDGTFIENTEDVFGELALMSNVHSITEIDFDNDGDNDLFFTRSEFPFQIESFYSPEENRFAFLTFRKDFLFEDLRVQGDLQLENLQRSYPNYDLFMGAEKTPYAFEGDPHGHQDITIKKDQAEGWPEGELKAGLYVGYLGDDMWRVGGQTHSRWAGAINNVISEPKIEPRKPMRAVLLENIGGKFVDATSRLGIDVNEQATGATAADFDNDGFLDLAVIRYGSKAEINEHILFMNKGGGGFERLDSSGIVADEVGTTGGFIEPFDYNADGIMDVIFSNERGRWHLLKNKMIGAKDNNFLVVNVGSSPSGKSALGARVKVDACGTSSYRTVGSTSASYSQPMNAALHYGLGGCDLVDKVSIQWADGRSREITNLPANQIVSTP